METLPTTVAGSPAAAMLLGETAVMLAKEGRPLTIKDLPPSLRALAHANIRAIEDIDGRVAALNGKIEDLRRRRELGQQAGVSVRGVGLSLTRAASEIALLERLRQPFMAGYLEMPTRDGGQELAVEGTEFPRYAVGANLAREVPVDVLEDLAAARESNVFDGFILYPATRQRDPHIVGVIRRPTSWNPTAEFLVAAWR